MSKESVLQAFFDAWEALQAVPVKKGAPTPELKAARELVALRADAVRNFKTTGDAPQPDAALAAYRAFRQDVQSIKPIDTGVKTTPNAQVTVVSG